MGAFYNSICLPGDRSADVRQSLARWLALRGFEAVDDTMLFDLDGETERSAYLLYNERWTVLVFSRYEEERRLIRELQTWADDVVYVWVQDSDVWGYDLLGRHGFVGSFASDPRSYQSFGDEPLGSEGRPKAEAQEVCQRLGLESQVTKLRKIERRSAAFEEDVCLDFCRLLGAEAAMVSYDDLESGRVSRLEGWRVEHHLFRHRDSTSAPVVDLHEFELSGREEVDGSWVGQRSATDIIPTLPEAMRQVREDSQVRDAGQVREDRQPRPASGRPQVGRHEAAPPGRWSLLRPLAWLARGWRRWAGEASSPLFPTREGDELPKREQPGGPRRLRSRRHGIEIELAPGMVAQEVSGRPASVFAVRVGEILVTCTSRRLEKVPEVLQRPHRSQILIDTPSRIHGLRSRHVLFELPPLYLAGRPDPSYLGLHVVEMPKALYVFLYRSPTPPDRETLDAIGRLVGSFRAVPGSGGTVSGGAASDGTAEPTAS